jgi:hypothetical protein
VPLRTLGVGYHALPKSQGGSLVLVEERGGMRMFLLFKQEQVDSLAFWFGVVPLVLVLAAVYLTAWLTYRTSRRVVSPVIWLARQVEQWDPQRPDASALDPQQLPGDVGRRGTGAGELAARLRQPHQPLRRARTQLHPRRLARTAHATDGNAHRRGPDGSRSVAVAGAHAARWCACRRQAATWKALSSPS